MKVLHLPSSFPRWKGDFIGGFVYSLCIGLVKNGIEVEVLTPRTSRSINDFNEFQVVQFPYMPLKKLETLAGHHLLHVGSRKYFQLPFYSSSTIYNLLKRLKDGDLIHAHGSIPMGLLGTLFKLKKTIITCHGSDCRTKSPLLRRLSAHALQKSDKNTTVSDFIRKLAIAQGAPKHKTETVYLGIDTERFDRKRYNDRELKEKYNIPPETKVITTIGRLVRGKRIEDFIAMIPYLSNQYDCVFFVIGDGPERKRLEDLGKGYKNLVFLGEFTKPEIVLSFTDVFVLCSVEEGLSTALQEAMAMECMPVAANAVGCPEIIENGINGYLFEPKNVQDLIEKTKKAIENNLRKYARKTILERFNRTKSVKRFIDIYEDLLG